MSKTALTASEQACEGTSAASETATEIALKAFRLWSAHPQVKKRELSPTVPASQLAGPSEPASQTSIWMSYYKFLSTILQRGMVYFPQSQSQGSVRAQLASEIRRIEAICENVLLREVRFPRANANNPQVESWVEQVIRNWEVLCGPEWRDEELGEGGQDAVGRNVLDVRTHSWLPPGRCTDFLSRSSIVLPLRHIIPTSFCGVYSMCTLLWQISSWPSKLLIPTLTLSSVQRTGMRSRPRPVT